MVHACMAKAELNLSRTIKKRDYFFLFESSSMLIVSYLLLRCTTLHTLTKVLHCCGRTQIFFIAIKMKVSENLYVHTYVVFLNCARMENTGKFGHLATFILFQLGK